MNAPVVIVPYDPEWSRAFELEHARLEEAFAYTSGVHPYRVWPPNWANQRRHWPAREWPTGPPALS